MKSHKKVKDRQRIPEPDSADSMHRPKGNAQDPVVKPAGLGNEADPTEGLHTVGAGENKGALGKTDVNLGQDSPVGGADAEGRDPETRNDKAA